MTARGWGRSRQTLRKAENSTAAASPTAPRNRARSAAGSRALRRCTMLDSQVRGRERPSRRPGVEVVQQLRAHLNEEQNLGRDAVPRAPGAPVGRVDADLQMHEAGGERRRYAVDDAAVGLAVAAGDRGRAVGSSYSPQRRSRTSW